ncbi:MAG: Mur ligase family protein [Firmicutes bacterium]|nr:Mur ligase family protein [Bacillota bacterium]
MGKKIHFIGIGGVSMMALAKLCERFGASTSGSDQNIPPGHIASNIHSDIDIVIINGAIADDNPELTRAEELGIEIMSRANLLAHVEAKYKNRIAIAGTHGKSTTTAMVGAILLLGGLNPTIHNGVEDGLVIGGQDFFVTEACEFKKSFLSLSPTVAVVTNVDFDHVDCYKNLEEVKTAFTKFMDKADVSFTSSDDIECFEYTPGKYAFDVCDGENCVTVYLSVPGKHNVFNAHLAGMVGLHFGIEPMVIKDALESYSGIHRRWETIGKIGDTTIISEYAHHPREIEASISSARSIYGERFLFVFQPHTYTRTLALFDDFVRALSGTKCVLYKTFSAREAKIGGGDAVDLADKLGVQYFSEAKELGVYLRDVAPKFDAIVLAGAGDMQKHVSF